MKPRSTLCEDPYIGNGGTAYGCGRCLPCRLKKRREWTHRLMLEAGLQKDNAFVTLTYAKDPLTVIPLDHRKFMDALRKKVRPLKLRFYMVAEYGEENDRPHYHYIIFGWPSCKEGSPLGCRCKHCLPIAQCWGKGLIKNLPVEIGSCRYVARYVVKKLTRYDDPRLREYQTPDGPLRQSPEFSRMSLKPGIGAHAVKNVALTIARYDLLTPEGDVPVTLRHGRTEWPLGRYLRRQLRKELGLNVIAPQYLSAQASFSAFQKDETMLALLGASISDKENPSVKAQLLKFNQARRDQIKRRLDIFTTKKGRL